jgi:hypothetical protein
MAPPAVSSAVLVQEIVLVLQCIDECIVCTSKKRLENALEVFALKSDRVFAVCRSPDQYVVPSGPATLKVFIDLRSEKLFAWDDLAKRVARCHWRPPLQARVLGRRIEFLGSCERTTAQRRRVAVLCGSHTARMFGLTSWRADSHCVLDSRVRRSNEEHHQRLFLAIDLA